MTGKIEQAWAELMKLPDEEQDVAAEAILDYASGARGITLSDEQVAEVERRLAEPDPKTLTISEFRARLRKLGV
jgi:putative addiction module component (TIGR02574 family)